MLNYSQFCPVATAAEIIGERWTPLIIRELVCGSQTFNEIRMGVTRISPTLLSERLKRLVKAGVIKRLEENGHIHYELTPAGEELRPVIEALGVWGQRWARSDLSKAHLDPGYLMWDIRRRILTDYFSTPRTVLFFEFSDYSAKQRRWWLIIKPPEIDLCRSDPGYDVDLHISGRLKVLTQVWMGDSTLNSAVRRGELSIVGKNVLKQTMKDWFQLSVVAEIKPAR